jgi:hypothetical protein
VKLIKWNDSEVLNVLVLMISRKCCAPFVWLAVIAINSVRCPSSHAKASGTGDRYTRELTTVMFPEMPQSDDASVVPDIPKTDPCYRFKFEGMDKHEFYSPGFEDKPNYTNNTNCVRVLEGEFLFSLITGTFNLPGSLR